MNLEQVLREQVVERLRPWRWQPEQIDPRGAALEISSLSLAYGSSTVVREVSLRAEPGEVICVMGRNGAGKTTLLMGMIGMLSPRGGSIALDGVDISRRGVTDRARAGIGYVPQGRRIFPHLTVLDNLLIGLASVGGKDTGQLDRVYDLFPALREIAGRTAGVLSGGQQQQLVIGRALMGNPRLLLLDEPTEGIQPSIVEQIEAAIGSLRGQMTIVLVEQFLDFALASANRCYVLERGGVALSGAPDILDADELRSYLAV